MNIFKSDKFAKEEEALVTELKLNCKNDGKEIDPKISATIFHNLGSLYLKRSKFCSTIENMISLIRCAVLLNAALVRTSSDANIIQQDIKQLNDNLLKSAEAENQNVDLCQKSEKVKLSVKKMRKHVDEELCKIPKVKPHECENKMYEDETNKVNAVKSLQNKITADYTEIMANLATDCQQIMGKPPCKFAVVGMGSLARKEVTPFSDFEHVLVLDSTFDGRNGNILNYFRWYSVIFQIILIHLGETIIPSVFNKTNSNFDSWFFDDITKSGVSFDGTFPWACKFPLGRQQLTTDKEWKTELIKSVPDMLKYLNCDESLKNGYHLADILTRICYVYGDQNLYREFKSGVNDILSKQNENLNNLVLSQIKDDLENFAIRSVLLKITNEGKYNVKKDVYRVTTLFITALGRLHNISAISCFDIIRQLAETNVISKNAEHKLIYAIAIACEIRLRWYMINKSQKDDINDIDATTKFLKIVGETSAIGYFQIAYALQCHISKRFNLKKGHFYSHPDLLNITIYSSFQRDIKLEDCINTFEVNPKEQRLLQFDHCLNMLQKKLKEASFKEVEITTGTNKNKNLCRKFFMIGQDLLEMHKLADAKEYLEKALKIYQQISTDMATDKDVGITLREIGRCLMKMYKFVDAKRYLEKALNIQQQISYNVAINKDVALTLRDIGQCFIEMYKLIDSKMCLDKALKIYQQISTDVANDRDIAIALGAIGRCLMKMNKLINAKEYLEKALKIHQQIPIDKISIDKNVALALHDLGECLIDMYKLTDAKKYLDKALQIHQRISNDVASDKDVANTLNVIGRCLMEMNKHTNAKECLEKALKIFEQISSDVDTDIEVALTLRDIGRCLTKMNKLNDAKNYLEKALNIHQRLPRDVVTERILAITLHDIGICFIQMRKFNNAKKCLSQSLNIFELLSNDVNVDRDIAVTLRVLSLCVMKMNNIAEAKEYLEKALKIHQWRSNYFSDDIEVAFTLRDFGQYLIKINKLTNAKEYLNKALELQQQISHDTAANKNVADTLRVTARCLMKLREFADANEYLNKALKIVERISSDLDCDRDVATVLHEIGQCLIMMNQFTQAKEYFQKALKIKERISNNFTIDEDVPVTLQQIGRCLLL